MLLSDYSLDHIIPVSRGGKNHPDNYFIMLPWVNNYFGNSWTAEKVAYIGLSAAVGAGRLRWQDLELKPSLLRKLQDTRAMEGHHNGVKSTHGRSVLLTERTREPSQRLRASDSTSVIGWDGICFSSLVCLALLVSMWHIR